jgi:galactose-1-phosphate uridylyltransferase
MSLQFEKESIAARFIDPSGKAVERRIEIRRNPITRRTSRVAFSRIAEKEIGTEVLPAPPPDAEDTSTCPFCAPQVATKTPKLLPRYESTGRLVQGSSILFPNLFPYGSYSAVSLFDNAHFVEIGTATLPSYSDSFLNCSRYLNNVLAHDPQAIFMAITQNHLPSAGGSLLHPHLQINADRVASNHHRFLRNRAARFNDDTGGYLFSEYLRHEKKDGWRYIGGFRNWGWTGLSG